MSGMSSRPKALVVGIHAWESPLQVGSHAIARGLAEKGWRVAYVSAPLTPFHWLMAQRGDLPARWDVYHQGGVLDSHSGVWHYVPFSLIAPDHRAGLNAQWVFETWHRFSLPRVVRHLAAQGFGEVDLLLLNSHFQPFWLDAVRYHRAVYRLADLTAGFPGCSADAQAVEARIVRRADLVVTAAYGLVDVAQQMGARSVMALPNGIRYGDFAGSGDVPQPPEYAHWKGPIGVYVGAFGPWVDVALMQACASARPDMHFVLIGPAEGLAGYFEALPNVHLLGTRSRQQLVPYLRHAHVGLIPFDRQKHPNLVDYVHPLKLYEYLACGLPVVSTDWAELRRFAHPATLCTTVDEFVGALPIQASVAAGSVERKTFAHRADWSFRVSALIERLGVWGAEP
jgi:glycosyltransferase involved in cell wall biosynthesis